MMRRSRYLNLTALCLVNFMWAAQYPAYRIASDRMDVVNLNFWTFVFAILLLGPFLVRERLQKKNRPPITWSTLKQFLILGLVGNIPPSVFIAWGISHSSASNAAIISLTIPVMMVLMGVLMLGEHMTRLRWISMVMAVAGTILVSKINSGAGFFSVSVLAGNALIFIAGAGSAFYNTYSKKLLEIFTELEVLVYSFAVTCAACAVISLIQHERPFYSVTGYPLNAWTSIFVLGAFSWGIAMVLWMWVLKRLEIGQVSASIYLLSLFGVILSAVTLHERLTLIQIAGGLMVLIATFLTSEYEAHLARREAEASGGIKN
jgi:drug/metabolite transporter (DMT)-like permease